MTDYHIVNHIIDVPCKGLSAVAQLKGKKMADWGRESQVDIILGMEDLSYCYHPDLCCNTDKKMEARKSIFGWVVRGIYSDSDATPRVLCVASVEHLHPMPLEDRRFASSCLSPDCKRNCSCRLFPGDSEERNRWKVCS